MLISNSIANGLDRTFKYKATTDNKKRQKSLKETYSNRGMDLELEAKNKERLDFFRELT